jgi:chromosome segregation ATPase
MNTLVSDDQSPAGTVVDLQEVELHVSQPGFDRARHPLGEGKSTVGSSPSCQIRLNSASVRPLQCLIVRKGNETTVTRWAAGIQLNGLDFTTSPLRTGDVLSIGELRLALTGPAHRNDAEVIEQSPVALIDEVEAQVAAEVAISDALTPMGESQANLAQADLARLHSANQQARQRFRRLVAALRELREEAHSLDQHVCVLTEQLQCAQQAQEQLTAELHQSQAIAAERESQYGEELDRAIAELTASYAKADAASQELNLLRERNEQSQEQIQQLSAELALLRELCDGHAAEKQRIQQQLVDREAHLIQLNHEIDELRLSFQSSCSALQGQNESLQHQLADVLRDRDRQITELHQGLEASVVELHEQNETLRGQLTELSSDRDQRLAELQVVNDSLRSELTAIATDRDQRIAQLEVFQGSQREELASIVAERDHLLFALREGMEASVRDLQIQAEQLAGQLSETAAERERAIAELQQAHLVALADAERQIEALRNELAAAAAERVQQVTVLQGELELARRAVEEADQLNKLPSPAIIELESELNAVRSERKQLAEEKHCLTEQLEEAEKRGRLLEIDARSVNAEWQRSQSTVARLQDELMTAQAYAADLDAKLADFQCSAEVARVAECDHYSADLVAARQELVAREQAIADSRAETERLHCQLQSFQRDLAESRQKIAELSTELERLQLQPANMLTDADVRATELTSAMEKLQGKLAAEIRAKELRIEELVGELKAQQASAPAEIAVRDARIAELSRQLEAIRSETGSELSTHQQSLHDLQGQLLSIEEKASLELGRREEHIAQLARELHETQDQLAECAAQGERLAELYRQAQADLATLFAAPPSHIMASSAVEIEPSRTCNELPQASNEIAEQATAEDPRDNDSPRLERALASLAREAKGEENTAKAFHPTSFIDRYNHIFDENDDTNEEKQSATSVEPAECPQVPELRDISGDDSAALEAYMANMMKRVRGETSSDVIVPPISCEAEQDQPSPFSNPVARMNTLTQRVAAPVGLEPVVEEGDQLIGLHELKQSSQKPPLPTSLSAMRALANTSARQAIAKHRKRRHFEGALSKLLVSSIAGATATYMLVTANDYLSPYFLAGCGVAVVSAYWGLKLCGILLEMIRDGINNEGTPAELTDTEDPLPIDVVANKNFS